MRNVFGVIGLTCTLLALAGATVSAGDGHSPLTIEMKAENGSNLSGSATLTQNGIDNPSLTVTILYKDLAFIPETMYPAYIHAGTCAKVDPKPAFALTPMNSGKSVTDIKTVTLKQLIDEPHAIVVHDSRYPSRYISCGDIYLKPVETRSGY
jgi:hypothetical protein